MARFIIFCDFCLYRSLKPLKSKKEHQLLTHLLISNLEFATRYKTGIREGGEGGGGGMGIFFTFSCQPIENYTMYEAP